MKTASTIPISKPFQYDPAQFSQCVTETLSSSSQKNTTGTATASGTENTTIIGSDEINNYSTSFSFSSSPQCYKLYQQHQSYYNRSISHSNTQNRFQQFIQNVLFVYSHNQNYYNTTSSSSSSSSADVSYYVTLNQFVDLFDYELPFSNNSFDAMPQHDHKQEEVVEEDSSSYYFNLTLDFLNEINMMPNDNNDNQLLQSRTKQKYHHIPNSSHYQHNKKTVHKLVVFHLHKSYLHHNEQEQEKTKQSWLWEEIKQHEYLLGHIKTNCSDMIDTNINSLVFYDFKSSKDNWETYLDWSTTDNPDGVPIVHPPIDQGICGSCWSFAATGSLEANAIRSAAMSAFYNEIPSNVLSILSNWTYNNNNNTHTKFVDTTIQSLVSPGQLDHAVSVAQNVEAKVFNIAKLSVQELLDCDTKYNQGCTGGNPIMSFPYIHKHGLVSSLDYPYTGYQHYRCKKDRLGNPIVTSDSWGILRSDDESGMKFALRHIGPLSVGFHGDRSFLTYSGGIFDSKSCSNHPNHALLITGYGEDVDNDGDVVKYWIARNSWGKGWGSDGYIKIKRRIKQRHAGVCGIAKNPSISIGGYLIDIDNYINKWREDSFTPTSSSMLQNSNHTIRETPVQSFPKKVIKTKESLPGELNRQSVDMIAATFCLYIAFCVVSVIYTIFHIKTKKVRNQSLSLFEIDHDSLEDDPLSTSSGIGLQSYGSTLIV